MILSEVIAELQSSKLFYEKSAEGSLDAPSASFLVIYFKCVSCPNVETTDLVQCVKTVTGIDLSI